MSEIRKPDYIIIAQKQGKKKFKIELFVATKFRQKGRWNQYRIRVNGKWFNPQKGKGIKTFFQTKWEFRDIFMRSLFKEG